MMVTIEIVIKKSKETVMMSHAVYSDGDYPLSSSSPRHRPTEL